MTPEKLQALRTQQRDNVAKAQAQLNLELGALGMLEHLLKGEEPVVIPTAAGEGDNAGE